MAVFGPFLAEGYTVIVPDTEGQRADFAAGPEYGMNTLDSIRAAFNSSTVDSDAKVAMLGYSGGAIATEWAAELAPTYAPDALDVNARLIGAAMGGVLVDPAHNLHYVEGSRIWAGVMAMALVGIARAFEIDFTPYLSDRRREGLQRDAERVDRRRSRPVPGSDVEGPGQPRVPDSREPAALRRVRQQADHGHRRYADRSRCSSARAPTVSSRARRATSRASAPATA